MCSSQVFLLNIFFIFLVLTKFSDASLKLKNSASDFTRYVIVQPVIHHGRTKQEISTTRNSIGTHYPEVQVMVLMSGEHWVLDLKLNEDLLTAGHTVQYQERGNTVQLTPDKQDLDLCHYSGSVRGRSGSWVAVSTCNGLSGVIYDGEKMRYIEPAQGLAFNSHYVYEQSDQSHQQQSEYRGGSNDPELTNERRAKRDIIELSSEDLEKLKSRVVEYNVKNLSRYVELVLVADHRTFLASGSDVRRVQSRMIEIANIIHSIYSPLNIYIALVGVVVWSEGDKIQIDKDVHITHNNFIAYKEQELDALMPNDNAHLWTQLQFDQHSGGGSYMMSMCAGKNSCGVASGNYNSASGYIARIIAHEMGHNLGMSHDENDCDCSQPGNCIMDKGTIEGAVATSWTSCNLKDLKMSFSLGFVDRCLRNKPQRLFESPKCGNGFIEPGEECDCGISLEGVINPCHACCHPDTCMLRANATCSAGACCDLTKCSLHSAGTVCRVAESECDLPEHCTGRSEYCPEDVYKMDSTPCEIQHNQAYCVRGECRTHTGQCRKLWGYTTESSHLNCYRLNKHAAIYGNCGFSGKYGPFKQCLEEDMLCGRLQCTNLVTKGFFEENMEMNSIITTTLQVGANGEKHDCRTVTMRRELDGPDFGLVPDGAKCGHEKMCMKQRCVAVSAVRAELAMKESSVCPSNCSGHGVCNSEGHCHCEAGFAPPLCATPGPGGSVDSGPPTAPTLEVTTWPATGSTI